jgi:hypothetical protein
VALLYEVLAGVFIDALLILKVFKVLRLVK